MELYAEVLLRLSAKHEKGTENGPDKFDFRRVRIWYYFPTQKRLKRASSRSSE